MQTEVIAVSENLSIAEAIEMLRREEENLPNGIFYIYVMDSEYRLRGVLRVRDLLFSPSSSPNPRHHGSTRFGPFPCTPIRRRLHACFGRTDSAPFP